MMIDINQTKSFDGTMGGNCGVVGCYYTDAQGNVYLNGNLIRTKSQDEKYQLQVKEYAKRYLPLMSKIGMEQKSSVLKEGQGVNQSHPNSIRSLLSKPLNVLIIGVVLVAGYSAYKKFKK